MALSDEARKARNEAMRKWRQANPEKVKASRERYWERVAQRNAQKA